MTHGMITRTSSSSGTSVRVRTHAKVNLFLSVLGRRPDRYHEVETILHAVDLFDDIEIAVKPGAGVDVEMICADGNVGTLPSPGENLIVKAADALIKAADVANGADVRVTKRIPIGAGLGGGSGNAAAALVVLSELWGLGLERDDLLKHAAAIGSDVSYCLVGGTALATARGEVLTPLPQVDPLWFVLAGMNYPLATRDVYGALPDVTVANDRPGSAPMTLALGAGDVEEVAALVRNDLEVAAFTLRPELEDKKEALVRAGALGACMSGSGPTMFAIARDSDHAHEIAARAEGDFDWLRVAESRSDCIQRLD